MSEAMRMRTEAMHEILNQHFSGMAKRQAHVWGDDSIWTSSAATGSAAYVFVYLRLGCNFIFPGDLKLSFQGNGGVLGLGSTGSLWGRAAFEMHPDALKGASGITFEASDLNIGPGGFQVSWYKDGAYIGHAEFYGAGAALGSPGGGTGSFS